MGVVVLPQGRVVPQGCGVPTPPKTPSPQLNAATAANGPVDASAATSFNLTHEQGERLVRLLISGAFARSPRLDGESEEGHQQRVLEGLSGETGIAVDVLVAAAPRLRSQEASTPLTNRGDGSTVSPLGLGDHFGTDFVPGAQASTEDQVLAAMTGVESNNPSLNNTNYQHPGSASLEPAVPFIFSTAPINATSSALTSGSDNAANLCRVHLPAAPMAGSSARGMENPSQHVAAAAVGPAASASASYAQPVTGAGQPAHAPVGANGPLPGGNGESIFNQPGLAGLPDLNFDAFPLVAVDQQGAGGSQDSSGSASAASAGWSLHVETATTASPLHAAGQPLSQGVPAVAGISAQGVPSFDFVGAHAALHPQQQLNLPAPPAVSVPSDPSLAGLYDAMQRLQQLEAQSQPQPQPYPQSYLPGLVGGVAEGASGVASMDDQLMGNLTDQSRQGNVGQRDESGTISPTTATEMEPTSSHDTRLTTPEGAAGAAQAASVNAPTFQAVRLPGASFHVAHYQAATVGQVGTINPAVVMPPPPMQPPSTSPAGIFDGSFDGNVQHFGPVSADPSEEELERVFQEVMGAAQAQQAQQAQQVQQAQQAQQAQQLQQGQQAGSAPFPPVDAPTVPSQAGPSRTARSTTTARQQAGPSRPRQSSSNATGSSSTRTDIVCDACRTKKVKCFWLPGARACVKCTKQCQDCVRRDQVVRRGPGIKTYGKAYYFQQIEGAEEKAFPQWWGSLTPKEQKSIAEEGKTIHDAQNPAAPATAAATAAAATAALVSASASASAADWSQSQRAPWTPRQQ